VVLVFAAEVAAADVTRVLDTLAATAPDTVRLAIVRAAAERLAEFQQLIDADRLFYVAPPGMAEHELDALIDGALPSRRADPIPSADSIRRIALAQSLHDLAAALRAAVVTTVGPTRARCLLFDDEGQVLWAPDEFDDGASPAVGILSFAYRTATTVCHAYLGDDPRCDLHLDDPDGDPTDRLLAVPVCAADGSVLAVLSAVRAADEPPFTPQEIAAVETLARHAAPFVADWIGGPAAGPFRQQALRELQQGSSAGPEPLRLDPVWIRRASWLVIVTVIALVLAVTFVGWEPLLSLVPALKGAAR
jgi:hypothetical protein